MGLRNGSSSNGGGGAELNNGQCLGPSTSSCGVRFDQLATVYSENGTTKTAIESKPDQVHIQINIENVDDDEIEEDNVEDDYYDEDEEDDEEEEEDDQFEEEMEVLPDTEKGHRTNTTITTSKKQRLKSLFNHFHSLSHDVKCLNDANHSPTNHNVSATKSLTRSSSLHASDTAVPHHQHQHPESWKPNDVDLLKFKRSSIAGFAMATGTGPLGLFKAQPRHYEETHL